MSAEAEAVDPLEAEADKLFAEPASASTAADEQVVERQVGESDPAGAVRLWTDNTGKYQVRARLVAVTATHVRLLKENGKFTTVPYGRLSQSDLAFVRQADRAIVANF